MIRILFVALAMALAGCSSSDDSTGGSDGGGGSDGATTITQSDYPADYAAAYCKALGSCCSAVPLAFDEAKCRSDTTISATSDLQNRLEGNRVFDPTAAGSCIATLQSQFATCSGSAATNAIVIAACKSVTHGTKAVGEACTADPECGPSAGDCDLDKHVCTAPITLAPHLALGASCEESCDAAAENCRGILDTGSGGAGGVTQAGFDDPTHPHACYLSDGLYCDDATHACAAPAAIGASCATATCAAGSFCDAGTCAALRADGAPCTSDDIDDRTCASGYCVSKSCRSSHLATASSCGG